MLQRDTAADFNNLKTYAYPGNSYVDYVSLDVYDNSFNAGYWKYKWQAASGLWSNQLSDSVIQDRTWEERTSGIFRATDPVGNIVSDDTGIDDWKLFADSKNKKVIISECGIFDQDCAIPSLSEDPTGLDSSGNNDNPCFIKRIYDWAWANQAYAIIYFEFYLGRKYAGIQNSSQIINHALLPNTWQTTTGTDYNPLNPETNPHPRAAGALLKALGATPASTLVPVARKYVGTLKIPYMDNDWLFQTSNGASPVYLARIPSVVKANVIGATGQWQGISFLGIANEVGYAFEGYCPAPQLPGAYSNMQFRITKNGVVIYSAEKSINLSSIGTSVYGNEGVSWLQTAEEMAATITNDPSGGIRIKVSFGPNVVGEITDSYQLAGRVDGQTYSGQTLNGVRLANKDVSTSWFYQENFDDGNADGFWLSGWVPEMTQLHAPASPTEKVAYRGSYDDQNYTISCQIASNVTGKSAGINFLTSAVGNGYRVELKSKDETATYDPKNILDTVKLYKTGWPAPVLLQSKTFTKRFFMGMHQNLKIVTTNLGPSSNKIGVYLNEELLFEYTDNAAVSISGVAGPWAEPNGSAWIDNYIQLPTI